MPVPSENTEPRRSSPSSKTKLSSKLSSSSHHSKSSKNRSGSGSIRSGSSKNKSSGSSGSSKNKSSGSSSLQGSSSFHGSSSGHQSPRRTTKNSLSKSSSPRGKRPGIRGRASIGSPERRNSRRGSSQAPASTKRANRPNSVSTFLRNTHRDLKQQIATLQGHISFIQDLATMRDSKKIALLFEMIDRDGGGTVDAEELATAMRQNDELSFSDSIEKAIDMVATFDTDGDGELDADEFQNYVSAMVEELEVSPSDFCEFLVVQLLLSQETPEEKLAGELARAHINEEVKAREALFEVLSNDRLTELFGLFDEDGTGEAPFHEVARGLSPLMEGVDRATHEALAVLLMVDKRDRRILNYEAFGRLLMQCSTATSRSLDDITESLIFAINSQNAWEDDFGADLDAGGEGSLSELGSLGDEALDSLTYKRLQKLFNLWDADGDGTISSSELADGLRIFQAAFGVTVDADAIARALITFDKNGDNVLDPREFSHAMVQYTRQFDVDMHKLIDFMCLTASRGDKGRKKSEFEQTFLSASRKHRADVDENEYIDGDVDFWE